MASTFTTGFGIEKIGSGEQSGAWGTTTNHNLDILDRIASYKAVALSGTTHTLTVREASPGSGTENLQDGMYRVIKFTGALGANNTVTIAPNTAPAYFIFENATTDSASSGPYSVILTQGSGANITIQNGKNAIVYCDGAGSGAAVVNALSDLQIATLEVTGAATIDGVVTLGGASQFHSTVTVGADDTGYDVKFFGATSGAHMLWDESADDLKLVGAAGLTVAGNIDVDGTTNLDAVDIDGAVQIDATLSVGVDDTGYDVKFFGATASRYLLWDESADSLLFSDNAKAVFGQPGNDLQIVHDTNNSFITDAGTGNLYLDSNAGNIYLRVNASENALEAVGDGAVTLYHNGSPKIATSAAGVTVTGGVTGVTGINSGQIGGRRNIVYNGAMKVAQRGTSVAWAANGYLALDRYSITNTATAGRFTMKQTADGPPGFANCLELDVTTADTSIAAGENLILNQEFEGQDLQQLKKGTGSAEIITISFYVKGNGNATYMCELFDRDNTRLLHNQFAVTSSWNRIELSITADTTGAFDDDNAKSLTLSFWLHAGTDFTSGTYTANTWAGKVNANRAVGISSLYSSTDNYFRITGIQMEIGSTATEFEHRTFGDELASCQRYLQSSWSQGSAIGSTVSSTANSVQQSWGSSNSGGIAGQAFVLPVTMRAIPTLVTFDMALNTGKVTAMNAGAGETNDVAVNQNYTTTNMFQVRMYNNSQHGIVFAYTLSAEL